MMSDEVKELCIGNFRWIRIVKRLLWLLFACILTVAIVMITEDKQWKVNLCRLMAAITVLIAFSFKVLWVVKVSSDVIMLRNALFPFITRKARREDVNGFGYWLGTEEGRLAFFHDRRELLEIKLEGNSWDQDILDAVLERMKSWGVEKYELVFKEGVPSVKILGIGPLEIKVSKYGTTLLSVPAVLFVYFGIKYLLKLDPWGTADYVIPAFFGIIFFVLCCYHFFNEAFTIDYNGSRIRRYVFLGFWRKQTLEEGLDMEECTESSVNWMLYILLIFVSLAITIFGLQQTMAIGSIFSFLILALGLLMMLYGVILKKKMVFSDDGIYTTFLLMPSFPQSVLLSYDDVDCYYHIIYNDDDEVGQHSFDEFCFVADRKVVLRLPVLFHPEYLRIKPNLPYAGEIRMKSKEDPIIALKKQELGLNNKE